MTNDKQLDDLELLITEFKRSGLRELHAKSGGGEIFLSLDPEAEGLAGRSAKVPPSQASSSPQSAAEAPAREPPAAAPVVLDIPEGALVVCAPYLGTFYRAPKPGAAPYVEVGSAVTAESELCLVEVMKLFTAVRAGVAGTVVQVLASDGELVAADQPLFAVMPG